MHRGWSAYRGALPTGQPTYYPGSSLSPLPPSLSLSPPPFSLMLMLSLVTDSRRRVSLVRTTRCRHTRCTWARGLSKNTYPECRFPRPSCSAEALTRDITAACFCEYVLQLLFDNDPTLLRYCHTRYRPVLCQNTVCSGRR